MTLENTTFKFYFALAGILLFSACGGDGNGGGDECEGDGCPCVTIADCPDPLNQICDYESFTCQTPGGADTGPDAGDTGPDVAPDAPEDVGGDAPGDGGDAGNDSGDVPTEDTDEDAGDTGGDTDVPTEDTGDADVSVDPDPDADVVPEDVGDDTREPPATVTNPWIAFIAPDELSLPKLYMIRATGSDLTEIETGDIAMADPALSPDGTVLAYRRFGGLVPVVKTVNLITGEVTEIAHTLNSVGSLGWSPDGSELICEGNTSSGAPNDLYRIALDGSGQTAIGTTEQGESQPIWFAEDRVYFVSNPTGIFELYYRNPLDLDAPDVQVTFGATIVGGASVSWDERTIAFVRRIGDAVQMEILDLGTGSSIPVGSPTASAPQIASDGVLLGYIDASGGNREIILADLTGAIRHVVTSSPGAETEFDIGRVESAIIELFWDPVE